VRTLHEALFFVQSPDPLTEREVSTLNGHAQ